MKDNIKGEFIKNRKLIIEVRYSPNPKILDERGALINKLVDSNIISNPHWELGGANITVSDKADQKQSRKRFLSTSTACPILALHKIQMQVFCFI